MSSPSRVNVPGALARTVVVGSVLLWATLFLAYRLTAGEEPPGHPLIGQNQIKTERCLACHAEKKQGKNVHKAVEAGCEACHESKRAEGKLTIALVAPGNDLCLTCHDDKRVDPTKVVGAHHPVLKRNCTVCHDPHRSSNDHLLIRSTEGKTKDDNLCLTCHAGIERLLAAKVPHGGAEGGCDTCHQTHKFGTTQEQQFQFHLTKSTPELCLDCHDVSEAKVRQAHLNQPFEKARCTDCHNPHGSDRPKLINTFVHSPFGEKQCDICHNAPRAGKVDVNEGGKRALCYMCHDDLKTQIEKAKVPHGLFGKRDSCLDCHSPHASAYPHQLRRATVNLCETCHTQRRQEQLTKRFLHPPVFDVGCTVCHDPHGSDNVRRLRASINDVCLACHGQDTPLEAQNGVVTVFGKVQVPASLLKGIRTIGISGNTMRGHPLGNHPISGPNPLTPGAPVITCVTCHNPHASDFTKRRFQLKPGVKSICLNCHA